MKTVFILARFTEGVLTIIPGEYPTYEAAEAKLKDLGGPGYFQIQKVFVKP